MAIDKGLRQLIIASDGDLMREVEPGTGAPLELGLNHLQIKEKVRYANKDFRNTLAYMTDENGLMHQGEGNYL